MQIAHELSVDAIVEGVVTRTKDSVRITAYLVDAAGQRLWAGSFDRVAGEVLGLELDVAKAVAWQVEGEQSIHGENGSKRSPKVNPAAYDLYLQGKYHGKVFRRQDNDRAIEFFEQAISRDPDFAQAYAALAFEYGTRANELNHSDET